MIPSALSDRIGRIEYMEKKMEAKKGSLFRKAPAAEVQNTGSSHFPDAPEAELFEIDPEKQKDLLSESERQYIQKYKRNNKKNNLIALGCIAVMIILIFVSFMLGRYPVAPGDVVKILASRVIPIEHTWEQLVETVLFQIRLPRVIAALLVGGSLAVAGAAYQGLFRNPMVSPDLLGASAGACVGACGMMLFDLKGAWITFGAFIMGMLAVGLSYILSKAVGRGGDMILLLVLCGMTVKTLFMSIVSVIKYLADTEDQLPAITYWLMGSIAKVDYHDILFFIIPFLIGFIPLMAIRWKLNILSFGEEEARSLGINVSRLRLVCIFCATLLTASVVAIAGDIGWVGLMIPHLVRFLVGPNNKKLLPLSLIVGAGFMLIVDNCCRCLLAYEIPLGVLTSFIGAPFFILILYKSRGGTR